MKNLTRITIIVIIFTIVSLLTFGNPLYQGLKEKLNNLPEIPRWQLKAVEELNFLFYVSKDTIPRPPCPKKKEVELFEEEQKQTFRINHFSEYEIIEKIVGNPKDSSFTFSIKILFAKSQGKYNDMLRFPCFPPSDSIFIYNMIKDFRERLSKLPPIKSPTIMTASYNYKNLRVHIIYEQDLFKKFREISINVKPKR